MPLSYQFDEDPPPEHKHGPSVFSQIKWNGGNPVMLCWHPDCRLIVCYAVYDHTNRRWVPGEKFR